MGKEKTQEDKQAMKKYIVEDHSDGKRYEVVTDELGYIRDKQPIAKIKHENQEIAIEQKPVSFEQIKKLYDKEFPPTITKPVNEVRKFKQLIDNARS